MSAPDQAYPFAEIVLYDHPVGGDGGGLHEEFPAIVHRVHEDGSVDLTPFTDFRGGATPETRVKRAPGDEPTPEHWRPKP